MDLKNLLRKPKNIYFIGILGSGMGSLASFMQQMGHSIEGSDTKTSPNTSVPYAKKIHQQHQEEQLSNCEFVVFSSAIALDNCEYQYAKKKNIPTVHRGKLLSYILSQYPESVAVCGSHGKTSVSCLLAFVLEQSNQHVSYVLSSTLLNHNTNACYTTGNCFVAEGDESDASFTELVPKIGIILNVDNDHLKNYANNTAHLKQAFLKFSENAKQLLLCADDVNIHDYKLHNNVLTYGIHEPAHVQAKNVHYHTKGTTFDLCIRKRHILTADLEIYGEHNLKNTLAVLGALYLMHVPITPDQLSHFNAYQGSNRRSTLYSLQLPHAKICMISDYAHHPKEINCCLQAIKQRFKHRRLVTAFQPHRYSRTKQLKTQFSQTLSRLNPLILFPTYCANEAFDETNSTHTLYKTIKPLFSCGQLFFLDKKEDFLHLIHQVLEDDDVLLMLGAGDIEDVTQTLHEKWKA